MARYDPRAPARNSPAPARINGRPDAQPWAAWSGAGELAGVSSSSARNISRRRVLHPYGDLGCRPNPLEHEMSKRSPATASKRARTKTAAKAQRAKPAVVTSPKLAAEHVAEAIPAKAA